MDVYFTNDIKVTGSPWLAIQIGDEERAAELEYSRERSIRFHYRLTASDHDEDGISILADAIRLPDGTSIVSAETGRAVDLRLGEHAFEDNESYTVDGRLRMLHATLLGGPDDYELGYLDGERIYIDIRWKWPPAR